VGLQGIGRQVHLLRAAAAQARRGQPRIPRGALSTQEPAPSVAYREPPEEAARDLQISRGRPDRRGSRLSSLGSGPSELRARLRDVQLAVQTRLLPDRRGTRDRLSRPIDPRRDGKAASALPTRGKRRRTPGDLRLRGSSNPGSTRARLRSPTPSRCHDRPARARCSGRPVTASGAGHQCPLAPAGDAPNHELRRRAGSRGRLHRDPDFGPKPPSSLREGLRRALPRRPGTGSGDRRTNRTSARNRPALAGSLTPHT
jgi:hypothetical protein